MYLNLCPNKICSCAITVNTSGLEIVEIMGENYESMIKTNLGGFKQSKLTVSFDVQTCYYS